MARQNIDTETQNPGWVGDIAKIAFGKVNENFKEIYDVLGAGGVLDPRRPGNSVLINGDFRNWQRGFSHALRDSGFAPIYPSVDRWYFASATTQVGASRQAFSPGQTDVPGNPKWYMRVSANSGLTAASLGYFGQTVEGVGTFAGQTCTVSFYARGGVAAKLGSSFVQSFGAGGSADVNVVGDTLSVTTQWQKYEITIALPSISGKTIGSANDHLRLRLWLDAGSNYSNQIVGNVGNQTWTLDIANVKWELGGFATASEPRSDAIELLLCQRYYEKSYDVSVPPGTATAIGREAQFYDRQVASAGSSQVRFKVTKRSTASVAVFSDNGNVNRITGANGGEGVVTSIVNLSQNGCQVNYTSAANNWGSSFHFTADAEL